MTIEEFEKNKIRYFDTVRRQAPSPKSLGKGACNIDCGKCIFYAHVCLIKCNLTLAEQRLQVWMNEHPVITNRDKFTEIFGMDPHKLPPCTAHNDGGCPLGLPCKGCEYNFWDQEYHEPKDKSEDDTPTV